MGAQGEVLEPTVGGERCGRSWEVGGSPEEEDWREQGQVRRDPEADAWKRAEAIHGVEKDGG